jgi:hypothetical protein
MKVVGIVPSPSSVIVTRLDSDQDGIVCAFHDEWKMTASDRLSDYVTLRARLVEKLQQWQPDAVCITALEPFALKMGKAQASWFKTAEIRGVVAEAARSVMQGTYLRPKVAVGKGMGGRRVDECIADDALWQGALNKEIPKKYRESALLALSWIRTHNDGGGA